MPEEDVSVVTQITILKSELDKCNSMIETIAVLIKLGVLLNQLDLSSLLDVNDFLANSLKPISREITSVPLIAHSDSRQELEQVMSAIISLYCRAVRLHLQKNSF